MKSFRTIRSGVLSAAAGSAVALLIISSAACNRQVESFVLHTDNPGAIELEERPGVPPEKEGLLQAAEGGYATPRYRLTESLPELAEKGSFVLEYSSGAAAELQLFSAAGTARRVSLPPGGDGPVRLYAPLPEEGLSSFRISADRDPQLRVHGVEIAAALQGYRQEPALSREEKVPAFSVGVEGSFLGVEKTAAASSESAEEVQLRFPQQLTLPPDGQQALLTLGYRMKTGRENMQAPEDEVEAGETETGKPHEDSRMRVLLKGGGETARFTLSLREGEHRVHFYSRQLGFVPRELILSGASGDFSLLEATFSSRPLSTAGLPDPLPADMGVMLHYPQDQWRRSDWELFSWNLFPSILVFDLRDYALQADFFKRLAFFVEKKGSRGEILAEQELEGRHGWNAHDYRAPDLARFFTLAEKEGVELNRRELQLRRVLLEQGVIERVQDGYRGGDGGVISITRESSRRLRYLFAVHEGYHGFFFAAPEFRKRVEQIWQGLSEQEQWFWYRFLEWNRYDIADPYLVINEFQAYLMQQHLSYVETYFKNHKIPQVLSSWPHYRPEMEAFLTEHPEHFRQAAQEVQRAALEIAGIRAGDLLCLRPVED